MSSILDSATKSLELGDTSFDVTPKVTFQKSLLEFQKSMFISK